MLINAETKYLDFQPFEKVLGEESVKTLKKAAEDEYGSMWSQTICDFFNHSEGDFSSIGVTDDLPSFWQQILIYLGVKKWGLTVLQYYWVVRFKEWVDEFSKTMAALTPPQSADSKKASAGCINVSFQESILVFLCHYFNLHSFREAEKMRISDLVIAKKDVYNKAVFEAAYSKQKHIGKK